MKKTFPAKISYALLVFVSLAFAAPLYAVFRQGHIDAGNNILHLIFLLLVYAFVLHLLFATTYTIEGNMLKIKTGFIRFPDIPIDEIVEIRKTNTLLSAPAPSFDRILIKDVKGNTVIISPRDKKGFIQSLKSINPAIKVEEALL